MRISRVQRPDSGGQNGMRSHDVEVRWFRLLSFATDGKVVDVTPALLINGEPLCSRREAESAFKARQQWAIELQCSAQSIRVELDE